MSILLSAAEMRALEARAMARGDASGAELMERAGRAVVEAVFARWPHLAAEGGRAAVLCGPGNNGGDGFVVARLLREWGWEVETFLFGDPDRLPPDARANCRRWREMGGQVRDVRARPALPADLMVDALFGTGLARPVADPALREWLELIDDATDAAGRGNSTKTVAVDIPSGLCADSGRVLGGDDAPGRGVQGRGAPRVMLTVSFHAPKRGHYLAEGPALCGDLAVRDIGLGRAAAELDAAMDAAEGGAEGGSPVALVGRPAAAALAKRPDAHKYGHGHALILAGGPGRGGAARLAARAALRVGAGLVTLACPPAALAENAARLDAIMLRAVGDAAALAALLADRRLNALCLGPGLGRGEGARAMVAAALAARRPLVLDADALTSFAADPDALFAMLHARAVLTPHGGEFARLFPDIAERLAAPALRGPAFSRIDAARAAAARAGCTLLLKGPDTVIAGPDGRAALHGAAYGRAAPWLATAGAGDVLAGLIAGLLARGLAPMPAAETAAWLHAEAARAFGPGLIAEDLPEALPEVLRALGV